jgi:hypothetical protein
MMSERSEKFEEDLHNQEEGPQYVSNPIVPFPEPFLVLGAGVALERVRRKYEAGLDLGAVLCLPPSLLGPDLARRCQP